MLFALTSSSARKLQLFHCCIRLFDAHCQSSMNRKILLRIFASQTFNQITALVKCSHCTVDTLYASLVSNIIYQKGPFSAQVYSACQFGCSPSNPLWLQAPCLRLLWEIILTEGKHGGAQKGKPFYLLIPRKKLFRSIFETQLSNLRLMLNSASHNCDPCHENSHIETIPSNLFVSSQ